jgi:hypothetical protein
VPGNYSVQIVVPPHYDTEIYEKPVSVTANIVSAVDFKLYISDHCCPK